MNYEVILEVCHTLHEYRFKHPNYFKDQKYINEETMLDDFYYEIYGHNNCAFRISFTNLSLN